jgi:putative endopeptidase
MKTRKIRKNLVPFIKFKRSVKIGDDFYKYVNGTWLDKAHLPQTAHSAGISHTLQVKMDKCLLIKAKELISGNKSMVAGSSSKGFLSPPQEEAIRDILSLSYSRIGSKTTHSNIVAFHRLLSHIKQIETKEHVLKMLGRLAGYQIPTLIGLGTSQDTYDRNYQVMKFFMGDYSLADRQYYWNPRLGTTEFFDKYKAYLKDAQDLYHGDGWDKIPQLEKKIYKWASKVVGQSDASKLWSGTALVAAWPSLNHYIKGLEDVCPTIDWRKQEYAVDRTATFHLLHKCLNELTIKEWQAWLSVFAYNNYAEYISPDAADKWHIIFGKAMTGLPSRKRGDEQWLAILKTKAPIIMNEFAREYCVSPSRRTEVGKFFKKIQISTIDILNKTEWLDPPTREKAIHKVNCLKIDIAYPKGSYKFPLTTVAKQLKNVDSLIDTIMIMDRTDFEYSVRTVTAPNHTPWDNPIYAVNAHYWDFENRIFFPAAILESPNFLVECKGTRRSGAQPAHCLGWNYGNLGSTLGHEITHAFDVEGMKVDHEGLQNEWATMDDKNQYADKVNKLKAIFRRVTQDDLHLDTDYIISEAIADLGGLSVSLHALKREMYKLGWSLARRQEELRWFFISYAYSWQLKMRPQARIRRVYVDEHPPAWTRVNYIVQHFDDWYEAFGIRGGDLYLPSEDRIQFFSA